MAFKNRGWSIGVVGACACFIAALGASGTGLNYTSFVAAGTNAGENPDVDGVCKVKNEGNANNPMARLHLTITGLRPGMTYGVKMDGDGAGFSDPVAFTANPQGHGSYSHDTPGIAAANTFVQIYIWDGFQGYPLDAGDDIFTVTDDELRANAVLGS
jgi:hypothetical protein